MICNYVMHIFIRQETLNSKRLSGGQVIYYGARNDVSYGRLNFILIAAQSTCFDKCIYEVSPNGCPDRFLDYEEPYVIDGFTTNALYYCNIRLWVEVILVYARYCRILDRR